MESIVAGQESQPLIFTNIIRKGGGTCQTERKNSKAAIKADQGGREHLGAGIKGTGYEVRTLHSGLKEGNCGEGGINPSKWN